MGCHAERGRDGRVFRAVSRHYERTTPPSYPIHVAVAVEPELAVVISFLRILFIRFNISMGFLVFHFNS